MIWLTAPLLIKVAIIGAVIFFLSRSGSKLEYAAAVLMISPVFVLILGVLSGVMPLSEIKLPG